MNMESSRSHSIATVYCETGGGDTGQIPCFGKVSFVDLAGSERVKDTKTQGGMLRETTSINRSLFTLGKVSTKTEKANIDSLAIGYEGSMIERSLLFQVYFSTPH